MLAERGQPFPAELFDQPVEGDDVDSGDASGRLCSQGPTNADRNQRAGAHHQRRRQWVEVTLQDPGEVGRGPVSETAGDDLAHDHTLNRPSDIQGRSLPGLAG